MLFYFLQLVEEVQARQPEVVSVLERAEHLHKDSAPHLPDKVRWDSERLAGCSASVRHAKLLSPVK